MVDENGKINSRKERLPFGEDWKAYSDTTNLTYGYTSAVEDDFSDLVHMKNRFYSKKLGRFISHDNLFCG